MTREFVRLSTFEAQCKSMSLDEDDVMEIENVILLNPKIGKVIEGTGGIRKFRISLSNNKGKSGGARIVYVDFVMYEKIYFITAFPKSEKDNLSKAERNDLKKDIRALESELRKKV